MPSASASAVVRSGSCGGRGRLGDTRRRRRSASAASRSVCSVAGSIVVPSTAGTTFGWSPSTNVNDALTGGLITAANRSASAARSPSTSSTGTRSSPSTGIVRYGAMSAGASATSVSPAVTVTGPDMAGSANVSSACFSFTASITRRVGRSTARRSDPRRARRPGTPATRQRRRATVPSTGGGATATVPSANVTVASTGATSVSVANAASAVGRPSPARTSASRSPRHRCSTCTMWSGFQAEPAAASSTTAAARDCEIGVVRRDLARGLPRPSQRSARRVGARALHPACAAAAARSSPPMSTPLTVVERGTRSPSEERAGDVRRDQEPEHAAPPRTRGVGDRRSARRPAGGLVRAARAAVGGHEVTGVGHAKNSIRSAELAATDVSGPGAHGTGRTGAPRLPYGSATPRPIRAAPPSRKTYPGSVRGDDEIALGDAGADSAEHRHEPADAGASTASRLREQPAGQHVRRTGEAESEGQADREPDPDHARPRRVHERADDARAKPRPPRAPTSDDPAERPHPAAALARRRPQARSGDRAGRRTDRPRGRSSGRAGRRRRAPAGSARSPTPPSRCWFDSAKNGPSTAIWVACARIAAIFWSRCARPSISVVTSSSSTTNGMSSTDSTRRSRRPAPSTPRSSAPWSSAAVAFQ